MRKMVGPALLCLVIVGTGLYAFAQQIGQLDLESLAKRPGFTVTRKVENGKEVVEIRKASVVITMDRDGSIGTDSEGAILCHWHIYVDLALAADFCFPKDKRELSQELADGVERLKDFIVANSLVPVARSDLDDFVQRRRTELFAGHSERLVGTTQCHERYEQLAEFEKIGREKRRAELDKYLDKLLAVPRPPVMNPCL